MALCVQPSNSPINIPRFTYRMNYHASSPVSDAIFFKMTYRWFLIAPCPRYVGGGHEPRFSMSVIPTIWGPVPRPFYSSES